MVTVAEGVMVAEVVAVVAAATVATGVINSPSLKMKLIASDM